MKIIDDNHREITLLTKESVFIEMNTHIEEVLYMYFYQKYNLTVMEVDGLFRSLVADKYPEKMI